jgi:hypothetical protein
MRLIVAGFGVVLSDCLVTWLAFVWWHCNMRTAVATLSISSRVGPVHYNELYKTLYVLEQKDRSIIIPASGDACTQPRHYSWQHLPCGWSVCRSSRLRHQWQEGDLALPALLIATSGKRSLPGPQVDAVANPHACIQHLQQAELDFQMARGVYDHFHVPWNQHNRFLSAVP